MTQEDADQVLGKLVRTAVAKSLPLDPKQKLETFLTCEVGEFGIVLFKIEVLGTLR